MEKSALTARQTAVSVVIPNLNGERLLEPCLRALARSSLAATEVIVVDNGSTDRSLAVVTATLPSARVIANERNLGFATASNQGARAAEGRYVLFLNSDVVVSERCLEELVAWAEREPDAAAWQPKLLGASGETWDSAGSYFTQTGFLWHAGLGARGAELYPAPRDVFSVKGACMLVRRDDFAAVGGFDDAFFAYFEETDLCWRLQLAGWRVRYVPAAPAYHRVGSTTTRLFAAERIDELSFRNRVVTIVKNAGGATLAQVLPVHLFLCLLTAGAFLGRGRPASARAVVRGAFSALARPRELRRSRADAQALRERPDAAFLPRVTVAMSRRRASRLLRMYLQRW